MSQRDLSETSIKVLKANYSLADTANKVNVNINNTSTNAYPDVVTESPITIKKKRKKQSYKDMMGTLTKCTLTDEEIRKTHNQKIKNCTGGGAFQKGNLERL